MESVELLLHLISLCGSIKTIRSVHLSELYVWSVLLCCKASFGILHITFCWKKLGFVLFLRLDIGIASVFDLDFSLVCEPALVIRVLVTSIC